MAIIANVTGRVRELPICFHLAALTALFIVLPSAFAAVPPICVEPCASENTAYSKTPSRKPCNGNTFVADSSFHVFALGRLFQYCASELFAAARSAGVSVTAIPDKTRLGKPPNRVSEKRKLKSNPYLPEATAAATGSNFPIYPRLCHNTSFRYVRKR
jgi:hypothetical protein